MDVNISLGDDPWQVAYHFCDSRGIGGHGQVRRWPSSLGRGRPARQATKEPSAKELFERHVCGRFLRQACANRLSMALTERLYCEEDAVKPSECLCRSPAWLRVIAAWQCLYPYWLCARAFLL